MTISTHAERYYLRPETVRLRDLVVVRAVVGREVLDLVERFGVACFFTRIFLAGDAAFCHVAVFAPLMNLRTSFA